MFSRKSSGYITLDDSPVDKRSSNRRRNWLMAALAFAGVCAVTQLYPASTSTPALEKVFELPELCPLSPIMAPNHPTYKVNYTHFQTEAYRNYSANSLSGAVQVDTVIGDGFPVDGSNKLWDKFYNFDKYLAKTFPLVYKHTEVTHVNTHGLVFTLHGTDAELQPLVLMAHQDVVPVASETEDKWTYPPFSGHNDGSFIWGRGSSDCKNTLIGIMESLTVLLEHGFKARRTVIVSFGFDEESSGVAGAREIATHLEEVWGRDSMFMVVDEGGDGVVQEYGTWFATPNTGEKGGFNAEITISMPGGHSSMPPPQTAIGVLAEFIVQSERNPYQPLLTISNPHFQRLKCQAQHARNFKPEIRELVVSASSGNPEFLQKLVDYVATEDPEAKFLITTTQAFDIINGGIKVNALPEMAKALVNHRVSVDQSLELVESTLTALGKDIAKKHKFALEAFGKTIETGGDIANGLVNITGSGLPVAPLSPTFGHQPWEILAGVTKHVCKNMLNIEEEVVVTPAMFGANTDTHHYWDLTKNIFRWYPVMENQMMNIHTVDERISLDAHVAIAAYFHELILVADQAK